MPSAMMASSGDHASTNIVLLDYSPMPTLESTMKTFFKPLAIAATLIAMLAPAKAGTACEFANGRRW
jgi:Cu/Ag efflux pump CusA